MKTADFDYILPPERIAQTPIRPRDQSKLMVVDKETGALAHHQFFEIGDFLRPGDLLVVNRSKVFKARLLATVLGSEVEIFLLHPASNPEHWTVLAKPGRKLQPGTEITFADQSSCRVIQKLDDGTIELDFGRSADAVFALAEKLGQVPTPPYVTPVADAADYQTVYAQEVGSVAAPTAGFHFTPELIEKLKSQGIRFAEVILHVGLGTFRPIKTDTLEEHEMHEEYVEVPEETRRAIEETKAGSGRVIAVGTTTVRALESGLDRGFTRIFITPGYKFQTVDALITNFHLPKSTLLVLISAFLGQSHADPDWGRHAALAAYQTAVAENYRFFSFGDAMFIH